MEKIYLCIDLKTFYASVECIERGLDPFKTNLVVANPTRGKGTICLAITPKMKNLGIKNRCRIYEIPHNVPYIIAMPRMKLYIEYSAKIYEIYLKYIAKEDIHVYSIDEAFLDITNYKRVYKCTPFELAKTILKDIYDTYGLTATVGIGTNMYLSKIALDIISKHSTDNIGYLDETKYIKELSNHIPLTDFWQIGEHIEKRLNKLNIYTMEDIRNTNESILYKEFGINAELLIDHSKGCESCTIEDIKKYNPTNKSLSSGQILFRNYTYNEGKIVLEEMIDNLTLELHKKNLITNRVYLSIGYSKDIIKYTKGTETLQEHTNNKNIILPILLKIYESTTDKEYPIRNVRISFGGIQKKEYEQLNLFVTNDNISNTINDIKIKYGKNSILNGINLLECGTQITRNALIGGHNAE